MISSALAASYPIARATGMDGMVKQAPADRSPRIALALAAALSVSGCDLSNAPVLDPKGPIALAERDLLFTAVVLMLIVVIPVFVMTFLFAWRYRASNTKACYTPDWTYSVPVDAVVWLVPAAIVIALGTLLWRNTHKLDPYRPIDPSVQPLQVEVIAQDWKWLFIYPAQGIAVVNQLVFPSGTPLSLRITSDTVMNSFYIPALGGQIYAMAGMQTRLDDSRAGISSTAAPAFPTSTSRRWPRRRTSSTPGWRRSSNRPISSTQPAIKRSPRVAGGIRSPIIPRSRPTCSTPSSQSTGATGRTPISRPRNRPSRRSRDAR